MDPAELLRTPPLDVTLQQVDEILATVYGLEGEVTPLAGERDRNFRVDTGNRSLNLKVANPAESTAALDMQQLALHHVRSRDATIPVPEPLRTRDGDLVGDAVVGDARLRVRATSYLPGRNVDDVGYNSALRADVMRFLARLDQALASFFHSALDRPLLWNLGRILELRAHTSHLAPHQQRVVESWLRHFESGIKPRLDGLPRQAIHGDGNPANLIVDPAESEHLTGIVDFGDMNLAPRAAEVGIAAAYQCLGSADPGVILAESAAAYHAQSPLDPAEATLVADLAITRLMQSLLISAWRASLHPDNREYILIHAEPVWDALQRLVALDLHELSEQIGAACATPIAQAPDMEGLLRRRRTRMGPGMRLTYDEPLHIVSGEGVWLRDSGGTRYLDAYNNVAHVGHGNPEVVRALTAQAARLNTNTRYLVDDVIRYAERLAGMFPKPLEVVFFANSGSEANDLAWRMAQTVTERRGMIVTSNAYHGSTYLTMATSPEELGAGNLESWVATVSPVLDASEAADAIGVAVARFDLAGEQAAAFACDTVFSSDGIVEPRAGYLSSIYAAVRRTGGLCIADEIQAGFGRVGRRMWGFVGHEVVPDMVTLGKPMGNGHPLAAVVTTTEIAEEFARTGYYFSTFAGNPVSAAAGTAVLDVMDKERLPEQAERVGHYLRDGLNGLMNHHRIISDVRGPGLFLGVEIGRDRPDAEAASRIQNEMRRRGVLIGRTGPDDNVLKIRPPLVFVEQHADQLLAALALVLSEV